MGSWPDLDRGPGDRSGLRLPERRGRPAPPAGRIRAFGERPRRGRIGRRPFETRQQFRCAARLLPRRLVTLLQYAARRAAQDRSRTRRQLGFPVVAISADQTRQAPGEPEGEQPRLRALLRQFAHGRSRVWNRISTQRRPGPACIWNTESISKRHPVKNTTNSRFRACSSWKPGARSGGCTPIRITKSDRTTPPF